jgi:hypothetical protein
VVTDPFIDWLLEGGVGPALVAVPVNLVGNAGVAAAQRLFRRLRRADDLSRLVKAATGTAVDLSRDEFAAVRHLLESLETWRTLGHGTEEELAGQIAMCLPPRDGRTVTDSHATALIIARGLLEFAVADLDPGLFQRLLLARLQRMETGQASNLDKALFGIQADLVAGFDSMLKLLKRVLDQLPSGPADRGEIAVYLIALIDWLNTDPWPQDARFKGPVLTPATIERRLRITTVGEESEKGLDVSQLAQHCRRLVILGGPGAGKTWLAKRIARQCAEEALKALAGGADLNEIELPLYVTCSRLLMAAGDPRSAAVASALDYELGDLGGSRVNAAVREFFTERNARTLLVIDSLDEAQGGSGRLRQADTLPWRIILTSRPSSWNHQLSIKERDEFHRVGELQPLRYPDDVGPFIQRWFAEKPAWGNNLTIQLAQHPALQQAATVPLILAFYCIIGGNQPLPESRRDLYTKVLNRILTGRWRGDQDSRPDASTCLAQLRSWAWLGATCHPVSQIGTWRDDIATPPTRLGKIDENALTHVATPLSAPDIDTGQTLRRFIHRSLREHLVAEYVTGLPVDEAVEVLIPHLWYDTDWEYSAPAAIIMHPQHDQLLRILIRRVARSDQIPTDLSAIDPWWQFRELLASIAAESSEDQWSSEMVALIGHVRVQLAQAIEISDLRKSEMFPTISHSSKQLRHLAKTAHWERSNEQVSDVLITHLVVSEAVRNLVDVLVCLGMSAEDKRLAREKLLAKLSDLGFYSAGYVEALIQLDPSEEEKRLVRQAILGIVLSDKAFAPGLVEAFIQLGVSEEDKQLVCQNILEKIPREQGFSAGSVDTLVQLNAPEKDKRVARQILLTVLSQHENGILQAPELISELAKLDWHTEDKYLARQALQDRLLGLSGMSAKDFSFGLRDDEFEIHLTDRIMGGLISGMVQLTSSAEDRRQTCQTLFQFIADQRNCNWVNPKIVGGMIQLGLSSEEKKQTRQVLLEHLDGDQGGSVKIRQLTAALIQLDPTPEEGRLVCQIMLRHFASNQSSDSAISQMVTQLVQLSPSAENRHRARQALLHLLGSQMGRSGPDALARGLVELGMSAEDEERARRSLTGHLRDQAGVSEVVFAARGLAWLESREDDRRLARQALLRHLTNSATERQAIHSLAVALTKLDPSFHDKRLARQTLLTYLGVPSKISPGVNLEEALEGLSPTVMDLTTWRIWAPHRAPVRVLKAARQNSTLIHWLMMLPSLGGATVLEVIMPNNGGFQHYADVNDSTARQAIEAENPVKAFCGWTWVPRVSAHIGDDVDGLPVCPSCEDAYNSLSR